MLVHRRGQRLVARNLVYQSDPARFMIWECYRDDEAIEDHKNSPHLAALRADTKDMVISRNLVVADLLR